MSKNKILEILLLTGLSILGTPRLVQPPSQSYEVPKKNYQKYLNKIKQKYNLEDFLEIQYYNSYDGLPLVLKNAVNREKEAFIETIPVKELENGYAFFVGLQEEYVERGYKSICLVYKTAFQFTESDFLSILIDHEYEHAKMIRYGLVFKDTKIPYSKIKEITRNDEKENEILFETLMEVIAYKNQLETGLFSDKISERLKLIIKDDYSKFYSKLKIYRNDPFISNLMKQLE